MTDKLAQLQELAYEISMKAMKIELDPKSIAIKLPWGYWMSALMSKDFRANAVYHPEGSLVKFELYGVTFYNDKSKPDWMK